MAASSNEIVTCRKGKKLQANLNLKELLFQKYLQNLSKIIYIYRYIHTHYESLTETLKEGERKWEIFSDSYWTPTMTKRQSPSDGGNRCYHYTYRDR